MLGWTLMAIAGATDAVGFLLFSGLYVSFMSGDATQAGVSMGRADVTTVVKVFGAQLLFVIGVALGHLVHHRAHRPGAAYLLLGEVTLLVTAAVCGAAAGRQSGWLAVALVCAVLAMGIQNAVLQEAGGTPIGTMVTGTLVRMGRAVADRMAGRPSSALGDAGQWVFFVTGALLGTRCYLAVHAAAFLLPALVALAAAVVLWRVRR
jgi:uncharacterized membrane protein YoaK (UPF0700 family)